MSAPRTVTITTFDHGEVTVPEPAWCVGHEWQPNPHRADITHNSIRVKASMHTDSRGLTQFMRAYISHAPFREIEPEPFPVVSVELDLALDLDPDDTRNLAEALRSAAFRLERVAAEAERLRGMAP